MRAWRAPCRPAGDARDIKGLRRLFDEFEKGSPAAQMNEYSQANIAFHQAIIAWAAASSSWT